MAGKTISIVGNNEAGSKTDDIRLAACLLSVGIIPKFKQVGIQVVRLDRPGNWQEFFFEDSTPCGKYHTADMISAWHEGLPWIEKNPNHPFAFAMAAQANHRDLMRYLRQGDEYAFMKSGKSVGMLPMSASAGLEEKILGKF